MQSVLHAPMVVQGRLADKFGWQVGFGNLLNYASIDPPKVLFYADGIDVRLGAIQDFPCPIWLLFTGWCLWPPF